LWGFLADFIFGQVDHGPGIDPLDGFDQLFVDLHNPDSSRFDDVRLETGR
jgi:hypothetical protein